MKHRSGSSVYPALHLLEDEGLVEVESASNGKTYALTKKGRTYVESHADGRARSLSLKQLSLELAWVAAVALAALAMSGGLVA